MSRSLHSSAEFVAAHAQHVAISGDVGVMGDEHAQRLTFIFGETAQSYLEEIRGMCEGRENAGKLYVAGLACIPKWNSDVVLQEVAKMLMAYPEAETLLQYCFASLVAELGANVMKTLPTLGEGLRLFLCRLAACPDAQRLNFCQQPFIFRRAVFVDALRQTLHDLYRRAEDLRPAFRGHPAEAAVDRAEAPAAPVGRETGDHGEDAASSAGSAIPPPPQHPPPPAPTSLQAALREEEDGASARASAGPVATRDVQLESPCFFF
jgi:hypothetical protein